MTVRFGCHFRGRILFCGLWVALGLAATTALARPPLEPLPLPSYSFDRQSPSAATGRVGAGDLLTLGPQGPHPVALGAQLGLSSPFDDLDDLSEANPAFDLSQPFVVLFSVDRATVGVALPDPALVVAGVPYNVRDQAQRGHAAGDQFMSTSTFVLGEPSRGGRPSNSALTRNNFNEGGTDFGAMPPTKASDFTPGSPQDNVDAMVGGGGPLRGVVGPVYFTATADSPSLPSLPGGLSPSGATIFFNADPAGSAPTELYASVSQLGLLPGDDIDGLVVFDRNVNGRFDVGDAVLFSLAPGSPSLLTIPGASPAGAAADVFIVQVGEPVGVAVPAAALGLGDPQDNIDALMVMACASGQACAQAAGIRYLRGDVNCDEVIDFHDIDAFVLALAGPGAYQGEFPHCFWNAADANCDGAVNFDDIDAFVACLSGNCPCP
mgnify:CR=1 FL=1